MDDFAHKIAVITGGGSGIGRELVRQLAREGCHVATCDVSEDALVETRALCEAEAPTGTRVTTCLADVSDEAQVLAFRDSVAKDHATDHVHLVINNAGISGPGSMVVDDRAEWERIFNVSWYGVYYGTRAFLPMLIAGPGGRIVNVSSINGLFASIGPLQAHTAYCSAKFAVRGFTEALLTDLRLHAPHVKPSLVFPGHIGTSIGLNSLERAKTSRYTPNYLDTSNMSDEEVQKAARAQAEAFRDEAPTTAAEAARVILDGVQADRWRILIGADAEATDKLVRENPVDAYEMGI